MNLKKALELRKAKYIKRTGSPGNYKYIYKEKIKRTSAIKEERKRYKLNDYEKLVLNVFKKNKGNAIGLGMGSWEDLKKEIPSILKYVYKDAKNPGIIKLTPEGKKFLKDYTATIGKKQSKTERHYLGLAIKYPKKLGQIIERVRGARASLVLGRNFGESVEDFFKRNKEVGERAKDLEVTQKKLEAIKKREN